MRLGRRPSAPQGKKRASKQVYEEEKMHLARAVGLCFIALFFFVSAGVSALSFLKTREIVAHPDVYRKQRDYSCSEETDDRELSTTGTSQILTVSKDMLKQSSSSWSDELNPNARFEASNVNEPELPFGYRNSTVGNVSASFLHDKVNNTVHTFANISGDKGGQAGWYMEYIPIQAGAVYKFETSYILDNAKAVIVAEEVTADSIRSYTDLVFLNPSNGKTSQTVVFMPKADTVKLRFFSQITSLGSMNIYEESVRLLDSYELNDPLITVSFDDGWADVYTTAKPLMDQRGIKSSQNIIAESFRSLLSGYMNLSEVQQLAKEGHEIASHSLRHCNLARLSDSNLDYDINASKLILESEFPDVRGLAYPYGSFDDRVEDHARDAYSYVRTTETGFDSLLMNRYRLRGITITPAISFEDFKKTVDFAVSRRLWINIIYHKVGDDSGDYGVKTEDLIKQLDYVKAQQAKIVTASEAVDIISKQQDSIFK
ncbi:MAG: polysaccharide deacetylase family protein [Candidatus Saccharibacteria bacterium]|nr:polysaccharide deacetylase family protein [Candidatus Saccharibacteria bacterium]